jgi:hypothetical protein
MELMTHFDLTFTVDDVLRGEGTDPTIIRTRRPTIVKAAEDAIAVGSSNIHPAVVSQAIEVVEHHHERIILKGGEELVGPLVAHHLAGAEKVIPVICTIGPELEKLASSKIEENPLLGMALDGLGNAAIEKVSQSICTRIAEQAQVMGLTTSGSLSPGDIDWPAEKGQAQIFSLLDPSRAGVKLSSSGMMIPVKSISFLIGIGAEMSQTDQCKLCTLQERCRYRHV